MRRLLSVDSLSSSGFGGGQQQQQQQQQQQSDGHRRLLLLPSWARGVMIRSRRRDRQSTSSSNRGLFLACLLFNLVLLAPTIQAFGPGSSALRIRGSSSPSSSGRSPSSSAALTQRGRAVALLAKDQHGEEKRCAADGGERHEEGPGGSRGSSGVVGHHHQQRRAGATSRGAVVRGVAAVSMAALTGWAAGTGPLLPSMVQQGRGAAAWAAEGSVRDEDLPSVAFKTKSGLRYYDVRKGDGASPRWGQVAIIQYEGYVRASPFSRLVLFDDTYSRRTPYLVKHGNGRVIRGLDEGLHTMRLGGLRRIVVPLELGYTKTGLGPIPPNALRRKVLVRELGKAEQLQGEIVYDVELVSVYDDEADLGYYDDLTFDPAYLQEGLAKAAQDLRDKGIKVPSTKSFMVKPEILGSRRREADVDALPDNLL